MRWIWMLCTLLLASGFACKEEEQPADDDTGIEPPLYADADADGVPDPRDLCPDTAAGVEHDARGCSSEQASGCSVELLAPPSDAALGSSSVTFEFDGDCEGYRLYASTSPAFPPHRRHLLADMLPAGEVTVERASFPDAGAAGVLYWAIEGSARGHVFLTPPRTLNVEE